MTFDGTYLGWIRMDVSGPTPIVVIHFWCLVRLLWDCVPYELTNERRLPNLPIAYTLLKGPPNELNGSCRLLRLPP